MNVDIIPQRNDVALYIKNSGEILPMTEIVKNTAAGLWQIDKNPRIKAFDLDKVLTPGVRYDNF